MRLTNYTYVPYFHKTVLLKVDLLCNPAPVSFIGTAMVGGWNEGMDRLPQTLAFPITMTTRFRYVKVIRKRGPWR